MINMEAANQATFFTGANYMGLSADAHRMLADEGFGTAESLVVGTKDFWDSLFSQLAKPRLAAVFNNADPPQWTGEYGQEPRPTINTTSQEKLRRASVAVMFYTQVGRPLQLDMFTKTKIDCIYEHVKKLKARKSDTSEHVVPVLGNGMQIQKYLHAFQQYCRSKDGCMDIPVKLAWIL